MFSVYCFVVCFLIVPSRCGDDEFLPADVEESVQKITQERKVVPIEELVKSRGYPLEQYTVTTKDDYILTVHRMRHGKGKEVVGPPVLLQHGILDSAACFMATPTGMAYHLADAGYDVWMGNSRGTMFSRKHKNKDPNIDKTYWDFSFHELGTQDLPAVLRHIQAETHSKVHYIGMSMGATQFLVMGSMLPGCLDMVEKIILLAPVAIPQHMALLATKPKFIMNWVFLTMLQALGVQEVLGHRETTAAAAHQLCSSSDWTGRLCETIARTVLSSRDLYDFENAKEAFRYLPAGSTLKTYKHYMQIARAEKFQQFDYEEENGLHYEGRTTPPEYDLGKITSMVYLISGGADTTATTEDVKWIKSHLHSAKLITKNFENFSHQDFLSSVNLEQTLYHTVDQLLGSNGNKELNNE